MVISLNFRTKAPYAVWARKKCRDGWILEKPEQLKVTAKKGEPGSYYPTYLGMYCYTMKYSSFHHSLAGRGNHFPLSRTVSEIQMYYMPLMLVISFLL